MGLCREGDDEIYHMALHSQVMIAYVIGTKTKLWKAYAFPVPGINHAREAYLWRSEGNELSEEQATALWPDLTSQLTEYRYDR